MAVLGEGVQMRQDDLHTMILWNIPVIRLATIIPRSQMGLFSLGPAVNAVNAKVTSESAKNVTSNGSAWKGFKYVRMISAW